MHLVLKMDYESTLVQVVQKVVVLKQFFRP
jgi:hypothetical protein